MDASTDLPEEVLEEIVLKCPVKSVVRFKSLSRSWQSVISEPQFSIRHLENQNQNQTQIDGNKKLFLFLAPQGLLHSHIYLMRLESEAKFIVESEIPYPSLVFDIPLCSCNGLVLLRGHPQNPHLLLWNPSIRKHIIIRGPRPTDSRPSLSHMYYDTVTDDYKIVFVYRLSYTVYSCNRRSWSDMKGLPCDIKLIYCCGASIDGCFYGMDVENAQVMCFDAKDGSVHKFPLPGDVEVAYALREECGHLYCHGYSKHSTCVLEKHGNRWVLENSNKKKNITCVKKWSRNRSCIFNMDQELVAMLVLLKDNYRIRLEKVDIVREIEAKRARYHLIMRDDFIPAVREGDHDVLSQIAPYSENVYLPCSNI